MIADVAKGLELFDDAVEIVRHQAADIEEHEPAIAGQLVLGVVGRGVPRVPDVRVLGPNGADLGHVE